MKGAVVGGAIIAIVVAVVGIVAYESLTRGPEYTTCPTCYGTGTIYRELRYQVIGDPSISEGGILDWKATLTITIRNTDDKAGYFWVTLTTTGGGYTYTSQAGKFISAGEIETIEVVESEIGFWEDIDYSYSYDVEPETAQFTCPECGGTGQVRK